MSKAHNVLLVIVNDGARYPKIGWLVHTLVTPNAFSKSASNDCGDI